MRDVKELKKLLPPRDYPEGKDNWFAQYGAFSVAAHYAGLPNEPGFRLGEWQHGWQPPEHNIHPEIVVGTTGKAREANWSHKFWVHRDDHERYLKENGFRHVRAIGHPFVYMTKPVTNRISGSILIMPPHTTRESSYRGTTLPYCEFAKGLSDRFSVVAACVSPICISKGLWHNEFSSLGIDVIPGADIADRNSLLRMALLFTSFEFVTMCQVGSQLAYSAYFGAKPSIAGPIERLHRETLEEEVFYKNCPEAVDLALGLEDMYPTWFRRFYVAPWDAVEQTEWAQFQLGASKRLTATQLRKELRWTPAWRGVAAARLASIGVRTGVHRAVSRMAPGWAKSAWHRAKRTPRTAPARLGD